MALSEPFAPSIPAKPSAVERIHAYTPAHRDRAVDGLRAVALLSVPLGHWLLGGFP